jgi:hypothetical protein
MACVSRVRFLPVFDRRENAIMWDTPGIAQMRLRLLLASETVLAGLLLAGPPRALALDPERRISQYGHTIWRIQDGAISPLPRLLKPPTGFSG